MLTQASRHGRIGCRRREKVDSSYIYRLARATNGDTLKFNVMIEVAPGVRIECALEYLPEQRLLRVITVEVTPVLVRPRDRVRG